MSQFFASLFVSEGEVTLLATILITFGIIFAIVTVRYILFAAPAYLLFWKGLRRRMHYRRIQQSFPKAERLRREFGWSILSLAIFACVGVTAVLMKKAGWTLAYDDISDYGWGYWFLSVALMIVVHDAYFYWTHRFMHQKPFFKYMHRVHHESSNPSPWASFSFHPYEAVVEASIIYVVIFAIPHHPSAIFVWLIFMTGMNVLGHLGYELFPKGFSRSWMGVWWNTSTHHNMHHRRVHCNYGLYFNYWDRLMGTNHVEYHDTYDAVTNRPRASAQQAKLQAKAGADDGGVREAPAA